MGHPNQGSLACVLPTCFIPVWVQGLDGLGEGCLSPGFSAGSPPARLAADPSQAGDDSSRRCGCPVAGKTRPFWKTKCKEGAVWVCFSNDFLVLWEAQWRIRYLCMDEKFNEEENYDLYSF